MQDYATVSAAASAASEARSLAAVAMRQAVGRPEYAATEAAFFAAVAAEREALDAFDVAYAIEQEKGEPGVIEVVRELAYRIEA